MKHACRHCQHLHVKPNAAGRVVIFRNSVYPCRAPVPEPKELRVPESVLRHLPANWHLHRSYMQPDDGVTCPTFLPRTKDQP